MFVSDQLRIHVPHPMKRNICNLFWAYFDLVGSREGMGVTFLLLGHVVFVLVLAIFVCPPKGWEGATLFF